MKKMEAKFPVDKPKEKCQDDGQEKTIANEWYVAQPFFLHGVIKLKRQELILTCVVNIN
jgi:hypothetical protein